MSEEGFLFNENNNKGLEDVSFHTLRLAMKSYFSTYETMKNNFNVLKEDGNFIESQKYIEIYIGTIIHFQHFFELFIKSILREIDEQLVVEFVKDPYVLYKLIKHQEINDVEDKKINTIGFNRAFQIFEKLVQENIIDEKYEFLIKNKEKIHKLNKLRNRILHRGIYILPYKELDIFVLKEILPIIIKVIKIEFVEANEKIWKGKSLECDLDIINCLYTEGQNSTIDYKSIALLKELGRSSYNNPLYTGTEGFGISYKELNRVMIKKYESIAEIENKLESVDHIEKCPCCGLNTLVCYFDTEFDHEEFEGNHYVTDYFNIFTDSSCTCCNFTINGFIDKTTLKKYIGENCIWDMKDIKEI